MANVTIYSTPTCPYCKMAKAFFQEHNVAYQEKDVAVDEQARNEMLEKSGQMGVPVIDIDGNIVVGFDKKQISQLIGVN